MLTTARNRALYHEASCTAFRTLMEHAASRGSTWCHYSNGELVIGTHFITDGDEP